MEQTVLDRAFNILTTYADELDAGENPYDILRKHLRIDRRTPQRKALHTILLELAQQDKLSLMWGSIESVYVNRGLTGIPREELFRAHSVVLVDVENVRLARNLPRHVFPPGSEIAEHMRRSGYKVRDRFACLTTKGLEKGSVTPVELIAQATALAQQDYIPLICPYKESGHSSPDDMMIEWLIRYSYGLPSQPKTIPFTFVTNIDEHGEQISPFDVLATIMEQSEGGYIPIFCPGLQEKGAPPKQRMRERILRFCRSEAPIETFVVVSGDKDFRDIREESLRKGYDFKILATSSSMSEDWRRRTRADTLELMSPEEHEALSFLERYLTGVRLQSLPQVISQTELTAVDFLDDVIKLIQTRRHQTDFNGLRRGIWNGLAPAWKTIYSEDFLHKLINVIASYTDLIKTSSTFNDRTGPGNSFAFNPRSKDLAIFKD